MVDLYCRQLIERYFIMLFNKNLSINKLFVFGVAISTLCANSNAMDNYGSSYNNRYNKNYNNLSNYNNNALNRTNINGGNKYKISYTTLKRDRHNIKVPTQSNNIISKIGGFTIKSQKDNTYAKITDMHNYFFKDGGTKKIDGTYDNSKKLIKGQSEIKTEVKKNNKEIKDFNKNMHNDLFNLEKHISNLIRNNQNNNNELNKNISNNFLATKQKLNDNIILQHENRNEIMKDFYDKFNETNKKLNDNIILQQKNTNTISQKIDNQTETIIEDASNKILESGKEELKRRDEIFNEKYKDIKEIKDKNDKIHEYYNNELKEERNKYNELQNERLKEKDEHIEDLKNIYQEHINLQEKTNDAILKNLQDSNEKKLTNQHIKNIDEMMHIVNNNYISSNINNKMGEYLLEKERLDMIERRNNILFQPNNNQNIISQNINQYQPVNNQYRRDNNNFGSVINREVVSDNYRSANRENIYNYANNINNIRNGNEMPEIDDPFDGKNPYKDDFQNVKEEMFIENGASNKLYSSVNNIEMKNNKAVIDKKENNNLANTFNNIKQLQEQNQIIEDLEKALQINKYEQENNKVNNQNIINIHEENNIENANNNENIKKLSEELNQKE